MQLSEQRIVNLNAPVVFIKILSEAVRNEGEPRRVEAAAAVARRVPPPLGSIVPGDGTRWTVLKVGTSPELQYVAHPTTPAERLVVLDLEEETGTTVQDAQ